VTSQTCIEEREIERILASIAAEAQQTIPFQLNQSKKKVIVLSGPTACGKTAFSIKLAQALGGQIISADSMQIYRGMNIGTSKISTEERHDIPHYLIDIKDIHEDFNVVDFYFEACHSCQLVLERDGIPIVVGGSGFYIHSLLYGPPSGPPPIPELRTSLEEDLERLGTEAMFERLKQQDPHYASTITKHDKQKIIRGLEIIALTGKKVSKHKWKNRLKPLGYDFRCWFLYRPKEVLYRSIEKRCEKMLQEGFLDEVKALLAKGLNENASASQAIGYRQAIEFLNTPQSPEDYQRFVTRFKQASRNYAKRQFTWFRREPMFRWLDMELHDPEVALDLIIQDYNAL
jgi:tRNA dimethylallyltransferase